MADEVVLLNSGGLDSRVSAAILSSSGMTVHSLFIDWIPDAREAVMAASQRTADLFCESHLVFPFPFDWGIYIDNIGRKAMPYTYVTSLALAATYAHSRGIDFIASGLSDYSSFKEDSWVGKYQDVFNSDAPCGGKTILLPVFRMNTEEVVSRGIELGAEIETTYSCLASIPPCGTCFSCKRRAGVGLL
jgi:7-cyano-7-deazaguanine synthase